ncbi:ABC-ATPase domain-containing protein [Enorma burkinafasonensis]|uniref:ABC-ATPase domain-containing protein n=1 Tax=Enorma burkinafasonensis TaxID=2590867 RepID=UPI00119EC35C|nr:ABC-ATPase domain-containing protein [Enorma burkinafasonensis]
MATDMDLERRLRAIDGRGYSAYKSLKGAYDFGPFVLSIDHVQGDPFAAPSQVSVCVSAEAAEFPSDLIDAPHRRVALEDLLVRRFAAEAARASFTVRGSGKSGLIATSAPGPEVLERSACEVADDGSVTLRLEAGFPAHGRTVDARALGRMLLDLIPACAERALVCDRNALAAARSAAELADDQLAVRRELERRGLVAFVADGSVLPRASGVSARPLAGAVPFEAPESLSVTLDLPHRGQTRGMGIPRGVTLVVGGGYHGKSTLLKALQEGIYDHVLGDGRELVITDATAMKVRSEDGRPVTAVDVSPFIANLPDGRDTARFSTLDASGSTSQAAATVEAIEAGARVLLIDEDTSATNFMVRDELMASVVAAEREPITPFVERVRGLWERQGVSSIIVVGSSGAFFPVADTVILMDRYRAADATERVRVVCTARGLEAPEGDSDVVGDRDRAVRVGVSGARGRERDRGAARSGAGRGLKVRTQGLDGFSVGSGTVDLRRTEQLVDPEQVRALAQLMRAIVERGLADGRRPVAELAADLIERVRRRGWREISPHGEVACGLALPRPQDLCACIDRWRGGADGM